MLLGGKTAWEKSKLRVAQAPLSQNFVSHISHKRHCVGYSAIRGKSSERKATKFALQGLESGP